MRGSVSRTIRERLGGGGAESRGGASEAWLSGRWLVWGRIVGDGSNAYQRKEGATGEKMPSTFFHLSEWRMNMTINKADSIGGIVIDSRRI